MLTSLGVLRGILDPINTRGRRNPGYSGLAGLAQGTVFCAKSAKVSKSDDSGVPWVYLPGVPCPVHPYYTTLGTPLHHSGYTLLLLGHPPAPGRPPGTPLGHLWEAGPELRLREQSLVTDRESEQRWSSWTSASTLPADHTRQLHRASDDALGSEASLSLGTGLPRVIWSRVVTVLRGGLSGESGCSRTERMKDWIE